MRCCEQTGTCSTASIGLRPREELPPPVDAVAPGLIGPAPRCQPARPKPRMAWTHVRESRMGENCDTMPTYIGIGLARALPCLSARPPAGSRNHVQPGRRGV